MTQSYHKTISDNIDETHLRLILEGIEGTTGEDFFRALVRKLTEVIGCYGAWVTEFKKEQQHLRAYAFWMRDHYIDEYEYDIHGTPCEPVIKEKKLFHVPDKVIELFPIDSDIKDVGAVSYIGIPLLDTDDTILGHLGIIDIKPMPEDKKTESIFRIFAARAAAELRRLRVERDLRDREERLTQLLDSAMESIAELNENLEILRFNPAFCKILRMNCEKIKGEKITRFLDEESIDRLKHYAKEMKNSAQSDAGIWIPNGLRLTPHKGVPVQTEVTLSRYVHDKIYYFTLFLRNISDRLAAEQKIQDLEFETNFLREEILSNFNFNEIIGQSKPIVKALEDIDKVASTDAGVLISGETGTGKELFARAIHNASSRNSKPLINVNCAAVPSTLMESEFFGHEKGAFTGATSRRPGRFLLANHGTIFLDEIGELPLELQAKLLRVLQEGAYEPVGSSNTIKVDVRVIAATNRDLYKEVEKGRFREDLYYRLNVFPVRVPPLRERGKDIILLANAFIEKIARKMGKHFELVSKSDEDILLSYSWPGNVRELQNVIERAAIIAREGKIDLSCVLPAGISMSNRPEDTTPQKSKSKVLTVSEMREIERQNLIEALETTDWRISGPDGAAQLLGMPHSTLNSKIKSFGIKRP